MDSSIRKAIRTIEQGGFNGISEKELDRFIQLAEKKKLEMRYVPLKEGEDFLFTTEFVSEVPDGWAYDLIEELRRLGMKDHPIYLAPPEKSGNRVIKYLKRKRIDDLKEAAQLVPFCGKLPKQFTDKERENLVNYFKDDSNLAIQKFLEAIRKKESYNLNSLALDFITKKVSFIDYMKFYRDIGYSLYGFNEIFEDKGLYGDK